MSPLILSVDPGETVALLAIAHRAGVDVDQGAAAGDARRTYTGARLVIVAAAMVPALIRAGGALPGWSVVVAATEPPTADLFRQAQALRASYVVHLPAGGADFLAGKLAEHAAAAGA
jgi:hypothetical protein